MKNNFKHYLSIVILMITICALSWYSLIDYHNQQRQQQYKLSAGIVSHVVAPILFTNNLLALQTELNRLLQMPELSSISISNINYELLSRAENRKKLHANTQYVSFPIRFNNSLLGYVQISLTEQNKIQQILLLTITPLLLLCGLILSIFIVKTRQHTMNKKFHNFSKEVNRLLAEKDKNTDLDSLLELIKRWLPPKKAVYKPINENSYLVVIQLKNFSQWKNSIQPQLRETLISDFETTFAHQLTLYSGHFHGSKDNHLICEFNRLSTKGGLREALMFTSGICFGLNEHLKNFPISFICSLTTLNIKMTSRKSLFILQNLESIESEIHYIAKLATHYQHDTPIFFASRYIDQDLVDDIAKFDSSPLENYFSVAPHNTIIDLWKKQLTHLKN